MNDQEIYAELWNCLYEHFEEDYDKTADRIRTMDFTKIELRRRNISDPRPSLCLTLRRPGVLIGAKGETVDAVSKYFEPMGLRIHIEEEKECALADNIIPWKSYYDEDVEEVW